MSVFPFVCCWFDFFAPMLNPAATNYGKLYFTAAGDDLPVKA
jgi:hypothetical protein